VLNFFMLVLTLKIYKYKSQLLNVVVKKNNCILLLYYILGVKYVTVINDPVRSNKMK